MKILDRYMLRTLLVPLGYCLFAFSMLFVTWDLFDHFAKFLDAKTPKLTIALYYGALLLPTFEYIVPSSLLLGTLYALWQLTRSNELMAMQASGIGLYRVLLPFLSVGLCFTLGLGLIKETVGTQAFVWTTQFRVNKFKPLAEKAPEQLAYYDSKTRRLWLVEGFDPDRPGELLGVKITQERSDGSRVRDLVAPRGERLDGTWWLHDLQIQRYDEFDNPVGGLTPIAPGTHTVTELPELTESPNSFVVETRSWEFLSTRDMIRYLREHPDISDKTAIEKRYDIHSRLAMPWACLIVTLFGIPAGAKTGRHNPLAGVFVAVGFFFAFYAITQLGLLMGKRGVTSPWLGAWLANLVFFVSGVVMLLRLR